MPDPRHHFCSTVKELHDVLHSSVCDALIIGLNDDDGPTTNLIQHVRHQFPRLHIVVCVEWNAHRVDEIRLANAAGRVGANDILIDGVDSYVGIADRVTAKVHEDAVLRRVSVLLGNGRSGAVFRFLTYVIMHVRQPLTVESVASQIRLSRRTLARECAKHELPQPGDLISWCRLLVAAAILDQGHQTVDMIGHRMFGSPSALRNMFQRYVGRTPTQLKALGAFESTIATFREATRAGTDSPRPHELPGPIVTEYDGISHVVVMPDSQDSAFNSC